ncbi:MAG: GFA family protein [Myxococcota bacterium]|nr:GFA family protein [Myxococcota bacterium]
MRGRCECGRVQYQAEGEIKYFSHCHCGQCRRIHGAAFASFVSVPREGFTYLSGESDLKTYASSSHQDRVFCGVCGSSLLVEAAHEPDWIYLALGTVEDVPDLPDGFHIFVGSKASWHRFHDDAPQYDTYPG